LLEQPAPGKWTVIQILEHLNSYGYYYLPAIDRSLQQNDAAVENFKPGWLGNYFTRLMQPSTDGIVKNKMRAPKDHRPSPFLDPAIVIETFNIPYWSCWKKQKVKILAISGPRSPFPGWSG
jgi:hypothetical protein